MAEPVTLLQATPGRVKVLREMEEHPYSVSDTVDYPESSMQTVMPPTEEAVGSSTQTLSVYNASNTMILLGQPLVIRDDISLQNGIVPVVAMSYYDNKVFGVCASDRIEPNSVGDCVFHGICKVRLSSQASVLNKAVYIKPNNGVFSVSVSQTPAIAFVKHDTLHYGMYVEDAVIGLPLGNAPVIGPFDIIRNGNSITCLNSSDPSSTYAGSIYCGYSVFNLSRMSFAVRQNYYLYAVVRRIENRYTYGIEYADSLPEMTDKLWFQSIARTYLFDNGQLYIDRKRQPGDMTITGRWL